jgi:integrase
LYYLLFATGLRPLEVARLTVRDYLAEDGTVRAESVLPESAAINGRARPLFFRHGPLDRHLGAYIGERVAGAHGVGTSPGWRGLDPDSPLFLDPEGQPYAVTPNGDAGQCRQVCRAILEIYRKIFRNADIADLSAQSARLTLMSRMYDRGADEDQVGLVLGIADRSAVRVQLPRPRPSLSQVLSDLS